MTREDTAALMSDIVERLLTMYSHRGDGLPTQYVNPDGPEAADTIIALRAEVEMLRFSLGGIFAYFDGKGEGIQAPGHSHDVPGIWDNDSDPAIAGKSCDWCAHWNAARSTLKGNSNG